MVIKRWKVNEDWELEVLEKDAEVFPHRRTEGLGLCLLLESLQLL